MRSRYQELGLKFAFGSAVCLWLDLADASFTASALGPAPCSLLVQDAASPFLPCQSMSIKQLLSLAAGQGGKDKSG